MKKITLISILTIIVIVLLVVVLTACDKTVACDNAVASVPKTFYSIESGEIDYITDYEVLVDSKTGVEYIYISASYKSAMTPRYNADGSLCVYNGGAAG